MYKCILFLACFAIYSCDSSVSIDEVSTNPNLSKDKLDLSNPKAGQKSYFVNYSSICGSKDDSLHYIGDTLVVEVVASKDGFYLLETLTPHSISFDPAGPPPHHQEIKVVNDMVLIPNRTNSKLFYFYGSDSIQLRPKTIDKMKYTDCLIDFKGEPFTGGEIGFLGKFKVGSKTYEDKIVVSCIPTILNSDAYLIYDSNQLHVSEFISRSEFNGLVSPFYIYGWRMVE